MDTQQKRFSKEEINVLFNQLGQQLQKDNKTVDIAVYGGTALMLSFDFREDAGDVDVVIKSDVASLKNAADYVAKEQGLSSNWLNDSVSIFTSNMETFSEPLFYPNATNQHLRVFSAAPEYLLAMKVVSLRDPWNSYHDDRPDIEKLMTHLKITSLEQVQEIVGKFYPTDPMTPRIRSIIEKDIIPNVNMSISSPGTQ